MLFAKNIAFLSCRNDTHRRLVRHLTLYVTLKILPTSNYVYAIYYQRDPTILGDTMINFITNFLINGRSRFIQYTNYVIEYDSQKYHILPTSSA